MVKVATVATQSLAIRILVGNDVTVELDGRIDAPRIREDIGTTFHSN